MLLAEFIRESVPALEKLYPSPEARGLVLMLCEERIGVRSYTHIVEPLFEIPEPELPGLKADMSRLAAGEPIQYVLGYTEFCGRKFKVAPSVLIPRPETGQLVDEALKLLAATGRPAKVLDLCTGSGCIAWSVALGAHGVSVTAADISEPALALARSQFEDVPSGVNVPEFVCSDLLGGCREISGRFDLLLSNPPYVMEKEKAAMRRNVLDHEPGIALFVPDDDPLLFYRALASVSLRLLDSSGTGIVEINEALGPETAAVFEAAGYRKTEILRDIFGKDRFVRFSSRV